MCVCIVLSSYLARKVNNKSVLKLFLSLQAFFPLLYRCFANQTGCSINSIDLTHLSFERFSHKEHQ